MMSTSRILAGKIRPLVASRAVTSVVARRNAAIPAFQQLAIRRFSNNSEKNEEGKTEEAPKSNDNKVVRFDDDEYDDYEPKTAGQKVAFYGTVFMRLLLLAAGGVCIFFTAKELFPGRMNPNSLFSEVFERLQYNEDILNVVGANMKAFGRDSGRNTEGRRNHVDSYKYVAEDGSSRLRVRFNIKGEKGQVHVWAEVSDRMKSDEYVYIVCQNARTGRVMTIEDKRDELEANFYSGNDEGGISSFFFKK